MYPRISKKPPFSVEVPGYEKKEGETIPRRNPRAKDGLINRPSPDVTTVYENLRRSADKFGNAKALGTRKIVRTHTETKKVKKVVEGREEEVDKKGTYFELGPYSYMSFVEYEKLALQLGCGLRKIGMTKGDKLHLFGATRSVVSLSVPVLPSLRVSQRTLVGHGTQRVLTVHAYCHRIRYPRRGRSATLAGPDEVQGHLPRP